MDIPALLSRFLSLPAATLPSYAADGRLYFLNDAAGSAQVWELPAAGGAARPRTAHRDAVSFVAGSPADGGAVFGRDSAGDERVQFYVLDAAGDEGRALTAEPGTMFGWGAFSPDGSRIACTANNRDVAHADPLAIDLRSGAQTRLAELQGPHTLHCWHPDGMSVTFGAAPRTFEADLFEAGAGSGHRRALTPHDGDWRHHTPRWRKDGTAFWLLTDRGREHLGVATVEPGGAPRFLYAPDHDVEKLEVSPDGSTLAVVVNEDGYSRLRLLDSASGTVVAEPEHPRGAITKITWRPDGQAVAFDLVCVTRPSTIWTAGRTGAAALVFAAGPAPDGAVDYRTVAFPTFDGRELPSFLAVPPGEAPAGGRPALIWVHGGPESQSLPNWRPDLQLFLALGFAVMVPNVRGSTGYGRAYAALDDREKRPDAVKDVAAAHAWLAQQPGIGGKRIAVMGQSYGGWMTLAAVTRFPELWAAGVDFYGIARWKTFFEKTGPWRVGHRAAEYGDPVRDAALLEQLSPLNEAEKIMCPMLVAQGMTDPRVPPHESEQIVQALRGRNVPVEYVVFEDEGHGFLKRDNRRVAYERVAGFLLQHLKAAA